VGKYKPMTLLTTVRLNDFPTVDELAKLNSLNDSHFRIDESRGYKRLLTSKGQGTSYVEMECPINQNFKV
jgi:hypothetical protein